MSSIFAKIVNGDLPCHKVDESEKFLAFLDITPLREGHVLVIPKQEIDYIFDLEDDLLSEMMIFAKRVAIKLKKAVPCKRIGICVIGLEVPHAHIHLVPLDTLNDMNFAKKKAVFSKEDLALIATKIQTA